VQSCSTPKGLIARGGCVVMSLMSTGDAGNGNNGAWVGSSQESVAVAAISKSTHHE